MTVAKDNQNIDLGSLPDEKLVRDLEPGKSKIPQNIIYGGVIIVASGILTGFLLSNTAGRTTSSSSSQPGSNVSGKTAGSKDTKTFPDSAEGDLEAGGINGEGTHKLIRPGGDSQTVYLTSSVLDLNQFVGRKVKVWGQTFSAKKAGWLMDVGRVEVL